MADLGTTLKVRPYIVSKGQMLTPVTFLCQSYTHKISVSIPETAPHYEKKRKISSYSHDDVLAK